MRESESHGEAGIVVKDVDIPFSRLATFAIKVGVAAIPVIVLLHGVLFVLVAFTLHFLGYNSAE